MSLTRSVKYYMGEVFFSVNDMGSVEEKSEYSQQECNL